MKQELLQRISQTVLQITFIEENTTPSYTQVLQFYKTGLRGTTKYNQTMCDLKFSQGDD
jgi:hypothetical protein